MHGRITCACPYCGDSHKDDTAKRGNIFWDTLQYHCYNCNHHTNLYTFLKHIFDFYLKWRNDIDEILNNVKFFDEVPTKNNSFGLYEFIIKGTEKAFLEIVKMIK